MLISDEVRRRAALLRQAERRCAADHYSPKQKERSACSVARLQTNPPKVSDVAFDIFSVAGIPLDDQLIATENEFLFRDKLLKLVKAEKLPDSELTKAA